jgi:hypothetical protein
MASVSGVAGSEWAARMGAGARTLALDATAVAIPVPPRARTATAALAIFGVSFMVLPSAGRSTDIPEPAPGAVW